MPKSPIESLAYYAKNRPSLSQGVFGEMLVVTGDHLVPQFRHIAPRDGEITFGLRKHDRDFLWLASPKLAAAYMTAGDKQLLGFSIPPERHFAEVVNLLSLRLDQTAAERIENRAEIALWGTWLSRDHVLRNRVVGNLFSATIHRKSAGTNSKIAEIDVDVHTGAVACASGLDAAVPALQHHSIPASTAESYGPRSDGRELFR